MSFFIPTDLQEHTPLPTNPLVYVEERPAFKAASRQFPGFPNDIEFSMQVSLIDQ